jgi:hypothetical protein
LEDPGTREDVKGLTVAELLQLIGSPTYDSTRYAALGRVFPNGRRLIPPKVTFAGVRSRPAGRPVDEARNGHGSLAIAEKIGRPAMDRMAQVVTTG